MPRTVTTPHKENRLSIRANSGQKTMLARAATARHMNISQFVLQASLHAAEAVIEEETRVVLSPQDYEWLCQLLDEPAKPAPRLRAALAQRPVWDV